VKVERKERRKNGDLEEKKEKVNKKRVLSGGFSGRYLNWCGNATKLAVLPRV
jgi:hypothetical protein